MPPTNADERATPAGWLDFYRATLIGKCDGLATWRREVDVARRHCGDRDLDHTCPLGDGEVTLR
ncbi:hypothetical protein [Actinomycetospora sp.]|uniref:hypothetical protein n=1 Tax=Actinomycetospora sp. TaxID=1872135 RepID=UPI002F3FF302